MFCKHCGAEVREDAAVCLSCGRSTGFGPGESRVAAGKAYCRHCGAEVASDAAICLSCGRRTGHEEQQAQRGTSDSSQLVWAILVTIFCCLPTGIPAIVYAAQATSRAAAGDYEAAGRAAASAKTWITVSVVLGLLVVLFYVIMFAIGFSELGDF